MAEHFDTSGIPDDPAYWRALEARVTAAMLRRESVVQWLTTGREASLAAVLLAFIALTLSIIALRPRDEGVAAQRALAASLAPDDPLGRLLVDGSGPPRLAAFAMQPGARVRGVP